MSMNAECFAPPTPISLFPSFFLKNPHPLFSFSV